QVMLAAPRGGIDDFAVLESQLDVLHLHAARDGWHREADRAGGRILHRTREDLAARHVPPTVGVDPPAALHAETQIGALGFDPDLADAREPLDERLLAQAQLAPRRD